MMRSRNNRVLLLRLRNYVGVVSLIIALIAGVWVSIAYRDVAPDWTGISADPTPPSPHINYTSGIVFVQVVQPAKTFWDWLQLLLVPVILIVGGYLFTRHENRYQADLQNQKEKQNTLQLYLDQMTHLILDTNKPLESTSSERAKSIARARTLHALESLNGQQKRQIILMLKDTNLIEAGYAVVELNGANLSVVQLQDADLTQVELTQVDFSNSDMKSCKLTLSRLGKSYFCKADLTDADLSYTDLTDTDFKNTNLSGANLIGANLKDAKNLKPRQLRSARRLRGATMANGEKYTGQFDCSGDIEDAINQKIDVSNKTALEDFYKSFSP